MGILDSLFRDDRGGDAPGDPYRLEMVRRVLRMSPRLRIAPDYWPRLDTAIGHGLAYVRDMVDSLPAERELSPTAWSNDPVIRAFFAAPQDVLQAIRQSGELRDFLAGNPLQQEAHAVLGMAFTERETSVSFGDHQLRMCAPSPATRAQEIVRRLVDQLLLEVLSRIAADNSRRGALEQERTLLAARLQLLEHQGVGMRAVIGGDAGDHAGNAARLRALFEENDRALDSLGQRSELLEHELDAVCDVFSKPEPLLHVASKRLHLGPDNVATSDDTVKTGEPVETQIARVPGDPPQMRAFTLVCCARAHLN